MIKKCVICGNTFTSIRNKKTCSKVCSAQLKKNYSYQQYLNNIKSIDKKRLEYHDVQHIIYQSNPTQGSITCDECGHTFNCNLKISHSRKYGSHTTLYHTTPSGEPICPVCGLIDEELPIDYSNYRIVGGIELEEYLTELRKEKPYKVKKYAIYKDKDKIIINFDAEAIAVKKILNYTLK